MTTALGTERATAEAEAERPAGHTWDAVVLVVGPLVAVALVATRYRRNWYFYDEFSMLQRVLGPSAVHAAFEPFNGHLYLVAFVTYRVQVALGLDGHAFVWLVFCSTLVACNVAVALTLRAARVPALAAVAAGVLVTYFGPGAQLMTLEFQLGMVGAVATSFLAAWIVLSRRPSAGPSALVAALLVLAITFDSGTATAGLVFVAVLLALAWRDRWAVVAFAPASVATVAYLVAKGSGPRWSAGVGAELRFGAHLVAIAAGGLVGGGQRAGAIVIVLSASCIIPALVQGRIPANARYCLCAGTAAVVVMTALLATTRAGLVRNDFVNFNRYVALLAFFVLAALLPALVSIVHELAGRGARWVGPAAAALLAVAFVLNLGPLTRYRGVVEGWQMQSHALTLQAARQLELGCADGRVPADSALPLGTLGPQLNVALLRELQRRGLLHPPPVTVSPAVRTATCARSGV